MNTFPLDASLQPLSVTPREKHRSRSHWFGPLLKGVSLGCLLCSAVGCEAGGVGDPCIPEDEYRPSFAGFSKDEVNIESRSFQCETRVCLVNNFQGRVSCPYGQESEGKCRTPDGTAVITAAVKPQLQARRPDKAVYCSCRCDGPSNSAPYCECPDGFGCRELIDDIELGNAQLAGSYCVRNGTEIKDPRQDLVGDECETEPDDCGPADDFF